MNGFGLVPFGVGAPFGGVPGPVVPPEPGVSLPSSRLIDFETGRYELDTDGNYLGMPDLQQRVGLLLAYGVHEPDLVGPSFEAEMEAQIRDALRPLTDGPNPAAKIKLIQVSTAPGNSYRLVEFVDGTVVKVNS